MKKNLFAGTTLIAAFFSCKKHECSEEAKVPVISYKGFFPEGDSALLGIEFEDCDGDIGLSQSDTSPPYRYNLFLEYIEHENGRDSLFNLDPPFYFRVPPLESSSRPLAGEIWVTLKPFYYRPGGADTIKYRIYLKDRALHTSNIVETPPIPVPQNKK